MAERRSAERPISDSHTQPQHMSDIPPIEELHFTTEPSVDTIPGPESKKLLQRQREIDSSAVAYPKSVPIALDAARGATVRDVDGNVFLDFFAGIGVLNVGHANPYVMEAVDEQLHSLAHSIDFPTEARLDLIEKLDEIAPGDLSGSNRVVFGGPTGSDAIEGSIKLAKYNTGGQGMIAFRGGYHGSTSGALTLTAKTGFKEHYTPLLSEAVHLPYPYPFRQNKSEDEAVEDALAEVRATLEDPYGGLANPAGIWVEPIQGEGGVIAPPDGFLPGLKELAEDNGIPLIVDEIQTGFGRTGEWFASDHYDVTPDAMTMAKALGGVGLPLSGMLYHEDLDTWEAGGHVGTFRGHAPAMRAGTAAIEYIQEQNLLEHARTLGEYIRSRFREVAADEPMIGEVRGKGLFIGVEFVEPESGRPQSDVVDAIQTYCYEHGVLVWKAGRGNSVLRLIPPLVLTREQAEIGVDIIVDGIEHAVTAHRKKPA